MLKRRVFWGFLILVLLWGSAASGTHHVTSPVDHRCPNADDYANAMSSLDYTPTSDGGAWWSVRDSGDGSSSWKLYIISLRYDRNNNRFRVRNCLPIMWPDPAVDPVQATGAELDPEGVAFVGNGWWVAEEYAPSIFFVDLNGYITKRINAPQFIVENKRNGRGFEGLSVDPATGMVYVILQYGLANADPTLTYILGWDDFAGTWTVWQYQLENPADYGLPSGAWIGSSGLHAYGPGQLLVIERDNQGAATAKVKQIWKTALPLGGSTDPVAKTLVTDVLAMGYPYEKLEGLTTGRMGEIYAMNDNDGSTDPNTTAVWTWVDAY